MLRQSAPEDENDNLVLLLNGTDYSQHPQSTTQSYQSRLSDKTKERHIY